MGALLEVKDLGTWFYTRQGIVKAVDNVDFQVAAGETLAIVGESGCGKSMTALSLMRLIPDPPGRIVSGTVKLGGRELLTLSEEEMRRVRGNEISMIFQEPMTSLNPVMTIGRQIAEALILHRDLDRKAALRRAVETDCIDAHLLRNVLELLLAHVADMKRELALDLLVGILGKADRAGAGQRLHASGNVDAIAVDVALVDDNITDVDADAEFDAANFGNGGVALGHGTLDFHGTTGCVDRARKFHQSTVTRGLDDTAAIFRHRGIDQFAATSLKGRESTFFINAHQAAIACYVGRKNCC